MLPLGSCLAAAPQIILAECIQSLQALVFTVCPCAREQRSAAWCGPQGAEDEFGAVCVSNAMVVEWEGEALHQCTVQWGVGFNSAVQCCRVASGGTAAGGVHAACSLRGLWLALGPWACVPPPMWPMGIWLPAAYKLDSHELS